MNNEDIKKLYVEDGKTISDIAKVSGLSLSTVRRRLISCGVVLRPKGNIPGKEYSYKPWNKGDIDDVDSLKKHFAECLPINKIAEMLGVSPKAVKRKVDELGLVRPKSMMSRKFYDSSKDEEIVSLYKDGKSTTEIGKEVGLTPRSVASHLKHCGVNLRGLSESHYVLNGKEKPADFESYEKMYDLYVVNHLSKREIADLYNTNGGTIDRVLKSLGIPIRGSSEAKIGLMVGDKHPNWKGGRSGLYRRIREYFTTNQVKIVLKRDNYTCQMCGNKSGKKHVHHIIHFKTIFDSILNEHKDLDVRNDEEQLYDIMTHDDRFLDLDNLVTYCKKCHFKVHGYGTNDKK